MLRFIAFVIRLSIFLALLGGAFALGFHFGKVAKTAEDLPWYWCGMHPQVKQRGPGTCPICHMALEPMGEKRTAIDPVIVQNMGLRTKAATRGPLVASVRAFGTLKEAEPNVRTIASKTTGYVEKLFADTEGMVIELGQPLFELFSPELLLAQEELIAARRSVDEGLIAGAEQKLRLLDVDLGQLAGLTTAKRTLTFTSPVAGTLMDKRIVQGASVMAGSMLLRVVDLTTLWLEAQVYESQLALVKRGQKVEAEVAGRKIAGEVVFIAPSLDEQTRTATVRIALPNPDLALKPGMYARIALRATAAEDAVLVPREAVIDTGLRQVVYIALGEGRFQPRVVSGGASGDDGLVQIVAGIDAGETVVTSGQFLLDAETRLREGMEKLTADALAQKPKPKLTLDAAKNAQLDTLVDAYLRLSDTFASDKTDAPQLEALARAVDALSLAPTRDALRAPLTAMAGKDLATQRKLFAKASQALIELVSVAPFAKELLVCFCPMYEGGRAWLQTKEPLRNPFYGSSMLECGEVQRHIAGRR